MQNATNWRRVTRNLTIQNIMQLIVKDRMHVGKRVIKHQGSFMGNSPLATIRQGFYRWTVLDIVI